MTAWTMAKHLFLVFLGMCMMSSQIVGQVTFYEPVDADALTQQDSLILAAQAIRPNAPFECLALTEEIRTICTASEDLRCLGFVSFFRAQAYMVIGEWRLAELAFDSAIATFRVHGDSLLVAMTMDRRGYAYARQGRLDERLETHFNSLRLREQFGAPDRIVAYSLAGIGGTYRVLKEFDLAWEYYQKAYKLRLEAADSVGIGMSLRGLGRWHAAQENYDEAFDFLKRSEGIYRRLDNNQLIAQTDRSIGFMFYSAGKYDSAVTYYNKALHIYQQDASEGLIAEMEERLAAVHLKKDQPGLALEYLRRCLPVVEKVRSVGVATVHEKFARAYEMLGEHHLALEHFQKYHALNNELFSERFNERLAQLQSELEIYHKDEQITSLRNREAFLVSQRNLFLGGAILLGLVALFIFYAYRQRRKAFAALRREKEKAEILLKEKEEILSTLRRTNAQLIESEKMASLGQLTAGVAHEINNPVNFITSAVQGLQLGLEDLKSEIDAASLKNDSASVQEMVLHFQKLNKILEEGAFEEMVESISNGAMRAKSIIQSLRLFSRNTSEEFLPMDVNEGLLSSLALVRHKIPAGVTVQQDLGRIPKIPCQGGRINQVFLNILDNALDAVGEQGEIHVSSFVEGEMATVVIQDNGPGITEEVRAHIFEPFYTTKEIGKGTGLGLSISYGIVQDHGGDIQVMSETGKGTEFIIHIPVHRD